MKLKNLALGILITAVSSVAQTQAGAVGLSDLDRPAVGTGLNINGAVTSESQAFAGGALLNDAVSFTVKFSPASAPVGAGSDRTALAMAAVCPVPEPASMTLIGVGLAAILVRLSRRPL